MKNRQLVSGTTQLKLIAAKYENKRSYSCKVLGCTAFCESIALFIFKTNRNIELL